MRSKHIKAITKATALSAALFALTTGTTQAATPSVAALAAMQAQLTAASASLAALVPAGSVLGVSTTTVTVPVRPVCRITTDKRSYKLGETIKVSWKTTGATAVEFAETNSKQKDALTVPEGTQAANGTINVPASVIGLPQIALTATSRTGHTMTCFKNIGIVDESAGKKDVRIASANALLLQKLERIELLSERKAEIDDAILKLQEEVDKLQDIIHAAPTTGTSTKPVTGTGTSSKNFLLKDVSAVTKKAVDPDAQIIDDEYTLYTITLTSGKTHEVKVYGNASPDMRVKAFTKVGFKGNVSTLMKQATATQ